MYFLNAKEFVKKHQEEIVLLVGVILISLLSFAAGYISANKEAKEPLRIEQTSEIK
ncbi:MAG: hypothetical protein ABH919_02370 [bacterium]